MAYRSKLDSWNRERDAHKHKFEKSFTTTDKLNDYKRKLEETFKNPSATLHDWDNFKSDIRKRLNTKTASTPKLSKYNDFSYLKSPTSRTQQVSAASPVDRYKMNSDLLYKNLTQTRPSSPPISASSVASSNRAKLSSSFFENRVDSLSRSKRGRLQDVIKLDEISRLQKALQESTDSEMKTLPSSTIEALHNLAELILKKTRHSSFLF